MTSGRIKIIIAAAAMVAPVAAWAGPAGAATPVACGSTVHGSATLHRDLHCHGDGVTVLSGTLNLNRHTISGDGTGSGVVAGGPKVTIKNGSISKFFIGVTASADGTAVSLDHVAISNTTDRAVDGEAINSVSLTNVTLRDNAGSGLLVISPSKASMSHSVIVRNGYGVALVFDGSVDIKDSVLDSNRVGLYCSQGQAFVTHSAFSRNDTGVSVSECEGSSFTSSAFVENKTSGLEETEAYADFAKPTLTLSHDAFYKNGTGLALSAPGRADVIRDSAFVGNDAGIVAQPCDSCDLVPNDQLVSNYFASNTSDGANWGYGKVTVSRNRFVNNGGWGFIAGAGAKAVNGGGNIARGNHSGNCSGLACAS